MVVTYPYDPLMFFRFPYSFIGGYRRAHLAVRYRVRLPCLP